MRISDWSSDVCSSDLRGAEVGGHDRLGDRRGHPATGLLAGALLALDDHGDGDGGGLTGGTRESHAPGVGAGRDRPSVASGQSVSVRVDLGGRRIIQNKKPPRPTNPPNYTHTHN